jgi:drug/metabolite transporter (DMT)-like permease
MLDGTHRRVSCAAMTVPPEADPPEALPKSPPESPPESPQSISLIDRFSALSGNVRGAIWILTAAMFFSVVAMLVKTIGARLPVLEILMVRQAVILVATLPVIIRYFPQALMTRKPWHHAARICCALVAMFGGFTAIVHLPLADAVALGFAKSFFITIFAIIFLKEVVGIRRWLAIIVGFAGVLIMLKPGGDGINIYGLMAVGGAAGAGLVMILIRYLSRFDKPITILAYQTIFVGLLAAPFAIYQWVWPTPREALSLLAIGLVSMIGQMCNIRAFGAGEATAIATLDYTRLLWAAIIGFIVFSETPTATTMIGAAIIINASIYTVWREAKRGQRLARSQAARGDTT